MILERLAVGALEANCYILGDEKIKQALIIDPGADSERIKRALDKRKLQAAFIVNTHGHFDHIGADDAFAVPVYIHKEDAEFLVNPEKNFSGITGETFSINSKDIITLHDGQILELGEISLDVIHTPGHTPGGICLLLKKQNPEIIFTGDTLFYAGIGRTDLPQASEQKLIDSIKVRILTLPDDTIVYPGHGPQTSVGKEKRENSFLQ